MASAAMLIDNRYVNADQGYRALDRHRIHSAPKFVGEEPMVKSIPTGLAPDLNLETTVPANPKIITALVRLHELKALGENWDSYGSQQIAVGAFRPALGLIIEAVNRCKEPTIVPLAEGGIGLRWEEAGKSLELDVSPDGTVEPYAEGIEAPEPDHPVSIKQATEILVFYCRA